MNNNLQNNPNETIALYPGVELAYLTLAAEPCPGQQQTLPPVLQLNYCRTGQIVWEMEGGSRIYLNPGDFSLYTPQACANSPLAFPSGEYSGLTLRVDLSAVLLNPPSLLQGLDIFTLLQEKICQDQPIAFLTGNEQTESIFAGFYDQPEELKLPYQKLKALEIFLYLAKVDFSPQSQLPVYRSEQVEIVRRIHDQLTQNMDQRVTIEELSRQYLINPTTLKTAFKAVYGTSLAAHIKAHRMEQAAKLLRDTGLSIAEIAQAVGYDSQSKFTAAFKSAFQVLPKEYRKRS